MGLTDFSQKKGQVRALEEFKKRKNRKQLQTSMALRKYRKLMKQEGMDAGTGASRKRRANQDEGSEDDNHEEEEIGWNDQVTNDPDLSGDEIESGEGKSTRKQQRADQSDNDENRSGSDDYDDDSEHGDDEEVGDSMQNKQKKEKKYVKPKKMDPFEKSRKKAELAKQKAEEASLRRASNEKDRQKKLRRRRQQTKLLQQRTKRGQPIMKHAINNLLYKLEKQQTNDSEAVPDRHKSNHRRQKSKSKVVSEGKQTHREDLSANPPQKKKKKARKFY